MKLRKISVGLENGRGRGCLRDESQSLKEAQSGQALLSGHDELGTRPGVFTPQWQNQYIYSQGHTAEYTRKIINVSKQTCGMVPAPLGILCFSAKTTH